MCVCGNSLQSCSPGRTVACQAPLSNSPGKNTGVGLPRTPISGDFPNLEIKPTSLMSPALAGGFFTKDHLGSPLYSTENYIQYLMINHNGE